MAREGEASARRSPAPAGTCANDATTHAALILASPSDLSDQATAFYPRDSCANLWAPGGGPGTGIAVAHMAGPAAYKMVISRWGAGAAGDHAAPGRECGTKGKNVRLRAAPRLCCWLLNGLLAARVWGRGGAAEQRWGALRRPRCPPTPEPAERQRRPALHARCRPCRALGSAPLVAGAVAQHLEANPGAGLAEVRRSLLESATPSTVTMAGNNTPTLLLYTNLSDSSGGGGGGGGEISGGGGGNSTSEGGSGSSGLSGGAIAGIAIAGVAGECRSACWAHELPGRNGRVGVECAVPTKSLRSLAILGQGASNAAHFRCKRGTHAPTAARSQAWRQLAWEP